MLNSKVQKKLVLNKETVANLKIRTHVAAGLADTSFCGYNHNEQLVRRREPRTQSSKHAAGALEGPAVGVLGGRSKARSARGRSHRSLADRRHWPRKQAPSDLHRSFMSRG